MGEYKYIDLSISTFNKSYTDGNDADDRQSRYGGKVGVQHPNGFLVYLPPEKIEHCDEYSEADPYSVKENLNSKFNTRRIELTVELAQKAIADKGIESPKILDIGCGEGHITERVRQSLEGSKISGLDYSISAIDYAHQHFTEIDFVVADAYEPPYPKESFDLVICNNIWEHVPDPLYLLSCIKKVLKPGGHIIVSTPSRYRLNNLLNILRGRPVKMMSKHHVTEYTVGQVKEQLAFGGFSVEAALSRPSPYWSIKSGIAGTIFSKLIALVGSHHRLEETIFYLAQMRSKD